MAQPDQYIAVRVRIVRFVSVDPQPGICECEFVDAHGCKWVFHEKTAIVTADDIWTNTAYPQPGWIRCVEVGRGTDPRGRATVRIDTMQADGVESIDEFSQFDVLTSQLAVLDRRTGKEIS